MGTGESRMTFALGVVLLAVAAMLWTEYKGNNSEAPPTRVKATPTPSPRINVAQAARLSLTDAIAIREPLGPGTPTPTSGTTSAGFQRLVTKATVRDPGLIQQFVGLLDREVDVGGHPA